MCVKSIYALQRSRATHVSAIHSTCTVNAFPTRFSAWRRGNDLYVGGLFVAVRLNFDFLFNVG